MTQPATLHLIAPSEDATVQAAQAIARLATPGVCILLDGPVGAGKTFLARAILHTLMHQSGTVEDVPSPTFTLVQTYQIDGLEAWHADLYRLTTTDELIELGLDTALETAFCMIEWPDRMGDMAPASALHISLATDPKNDDKREITIQGPQKLLAQISAALESAPL